MKKLIAMIATVAVVLSMGVTAMADAIDKTEKKSPEKEKIVSEVKGESDYEAIFTERSGASLSGAQYAGLDDIVKDGQKARVFDVEVFGAKLEKNDQGLFDLKTFDDKDLATAKGGSFEIVVAFDGANDVLDVKIWDAEMGKWSDVIAWEAKDGKVTITTGRDGVFAFVMEPAADDAADDADANKAGGKKSAATGYNSTAYIVCAIALAAGAAFFFGTSKKSAKEMM